MSQAKPKQRPDAAAIEAGKRKSPCGSTTAARLRPRSWPVRRPACTSADKVLQSQGRARSGALPPSTTDLSTSPSARPRWSAGGALLEDLVWSFERLGLLRIWHKSDGRRGMDFVRPPSEWLAQDYQPSAGAAQAALRRRNPSGQRPARLRASGLIAEPIPVSEPCRAWVRCCCTRLSGKFR